MSKTKSQKLQNLGKKFLAVVVSPKAIVAGGLFGVMKLAKSVISNGNFTTSEIIKEAFAYGYASNVIAQLIQSSIKGSDNNSKAIGLKDCSKAVIKNISDFKNKGDLNHALSGAAHQFPQKLFESYDKKELTLAALPKIAFDAIVEGGFSGLAIHALAEDLKTAELKDIKNFLMPGVPATAAFITVLISYFTDDKGKLLDAARQGFNTYLASHLSEPNVHQKSDIIDGYPDTLDINLPDIKLNDEL